MRTALFFIIMISYISLSAQYVDEHGHSHPYELDFKEELKYFGVGGLGFGLAYYLRKNTDLLTEDFINALDSDGINSLDRYAVSQNSSTARSLSNYITFGSFTVPVFFLAEKHCRGSIGDIAIMWLEANIITLAITDVLKYSVKRTRPYAYNDEVSIEEKLSLNTRLSFISGHASFAASNSFFGAKVFTDHYPDSKLKPYVWTVAAILPAISAFNRVKAGRHFPTDVMVGYAVGATMGILVPELHRVDSEAHQHLTISPYGNGVHVLFEF